MSSSRFILLIAAVSAVAAAVVVLLSRSSAEPDRADGGSGVLISYAQEPTKILIEPETGDVSPPYQVEENAECGGGKCLYLPEGPGSKEINPKLKTAPGPDGVPVPYKDISKGKYAGKPLYPNGTFRVGFDVQEAGDYELWGRVWWDSACANSFYFLIDPASDPVDSDGNGEFDDEIVPIRFGEDGQYRTWHWVKCSGVTFRLKPGKHIFVGYNREDGHRIDQLLLVKKTEGFDFYPSGIETEGKHRE